MIVHSDSEFGFVLAVLLTLAAIVSLFASVVFAVRRKFHFAIKVAGVTFGAMAAWILVVTVVSFATPQTVVKVGDSYCADIRCIGIDKVHAEVKGPETIYDLEVRLFSDANTVKVTFGGVSPVLMDEQGRRYPMVSSSDSRLALDAYLDPGQTIKTTAMRRRELLKRRTL